MYIQYATFVQKKQYKRTTKASPCFTYDNIHVSMVFSQIIPPSPSPTGCSGLVHWDDPEVWDGEEGGKGVQDGRHMYAYG